MTAPGLEVDYGIASETGVRARNEDYAAVVVPEPPVIARRGVVAAVADGVGGAPGGREAAETAVGTFIECYYAAPKRLSPRRAAARAFKTADERVFETGEDNPELSGMCTTLSAVVLCRGSALVVHVGDTRIYRLRGDALATLTQDHNLGAEGLPHILTRTVGGHFVAEPDILDYDAAPGDRYLLCSDGVCGTLPDTAIGAVLQAGPPAAAAERLIAEALAAGSMDNVTAVVVDVTAAPRR